MVSLPAEKFREILNQLWLVGSDHILLGSLAVAEGTPVTVAVETGLDMVTVKVKYSSLSSIAQRLSADVKIERDGGKLKIRSGRYRHELPVELGVSPMLTPVSEHGYQFQSSQLKELMGFVHQACDKQDGIGSVMQLRGDGKHLRAVGSDGWRMGYIEIPSPIVLPPVLIPLGAFKALAGLKTQFVQMHFDAGRIVAQAGPTTLYINKPSLQYPNVESFVPQEFKFEAQVDAKETHETLLGVQHIIAEQEDKHVEFEFKNDVLTVSASGSAGSSTGESQYEQITPDPLDLSMPAVFKTHHKTLTDFMGYVSGPVTVGLDKTGLRVLLTCGNKRVLRVCN